MTERDLPNGFRISTVNVISWLVVAVLSVGWLYLETRLDNLETGKTTMMAESTKLKFDEVFKRQNEQQALVERLYDRVRQLEIELAKHNAARQRIGELNKEIHASTD